MRVPRGVLMASALCLSVFLQGSLLRAEEPLFPPLVPPMDFDEARSLQNPYPMSKEMIAAGKAIYEGKAYCAACHGKDGRGFGKDMKPGSVDYPFPQDFTNGSWQEARTDGELFWVLMNGSHGTDMSAFFPLYLSEMETWQVVAYIRTFWEKGRKL